MTDITIPEELLPADGRFGSGPSKVRQDFVDRLQSTGPHLLGTSHRRPAVKDQVRRIREGLRQLFALPDDYEVALGNGGATLFWDAAGYCLIRERSAHAAFGEFSNKFASVVAAMPFLTDPEVVRAEPGTHPTLEGVDGVDAYALTHNETSTGVMMPVARPGGAANDSLVLVDATSAAGGVPVDPRDFDAYYFSPQKCFGSEGGLWLALLSPSALYRLDEIAATGRYVPAMLDLRIALDNSRKDQTYNTPAVATLFLMAEQIEAMLDQGGLDAVAKGCAAKAATVYDWAAQRDWATPFVTDPAQRSTVNATIDFDESVPAGDVAKALRANGILDTEAYRKLGRNQLRVGVFPAVDTGDVERLVGCIDYVAERLRG